MPASIRRKKLFSALILIMLAAAPVALFAAEQIAPAPDPIVPPARSTVVIMPLEGLIDRGLYDSVVRRLAEAKAFEPVMIIFTIDTYGGFLTSAIEITDIIGGIEEPRTVAFVPTKAYSAGAMISMGAREIVLTPSSSIGDAAPVVQTAEGQEIVGEKAQSPTRSMFRKYAQRNGYPPALVEAMVTPELEVVEVTFNDGSVEYMLSSAYEDLTDDRKSQVAKKRVVVREGEILTLTASEAANYGIARFVVKDIDELLEKYGLAGARRIILDVNWLEGLVRWLNSPLIAMLLLAGGILGLYVEFKIPGFGLPGIVGVSCLAVFLFSKHLTGLAEYWEILVIVVGVILLAIELFVIPGFGVTGLAGATLLVVGLLLTLVPSHITTAPLDIEFLARAGGYFVATLVATFLAAWGLALVLPHTPVVGKFFLGPPEAQAVPHSAAAGVTEGRKSLLGKVGTAVTSLRPAGRGKFAGEYYDVTTEGSHVANGSRIEVIALRGNNLIVREIA